MALSGWGFKFDKFKLSGLHTKHGVKRGISVPTEVLP